MWTCGSTSPGTTVRPPRLMTRAPGAGGGAVPDADNPPVPQGHRVGDGIGVFQGVDPSIGEHENFFWRDVLAGDHDGGRSGC